MPVLKASLVMPYYLNNRIFDINDLLVNRDNCSYYAYHLKEILKNYNIDLSTQDINTVNDSDVVVYHDMPEKLPQGNQIDKSYLILFESEVIKPDNFKHDNHKYFKKIFTWNDELVDNKKYYKFNYTHKFPSDLNFNLNREKLCTLIAGNKKLSHPLELCSKRLEAIKWFESNQPDYFEFYGIGWDLPANKWIKRIMRRTSSAFVRDLLMKSAPRYSSYKGPVVSKNEVLKKYKFAICYENARDLPGYITEKIFDCFFAGCIPIYWGANNITDHIPSNCFIDKRHFDSYQELFDYISTMNSATYTEYLENIKMYLLSNEAYQFSTDGFVETMLREVFQ